MRVFVLLRKQFVLSSDLFLSHTRRFSNLVYGLGYSYSGVVPCGFRHAPRSATTLPSCQGPIRINTFMKDNVDVCDIASGYGFALIHGKDQHSDVSCLYGVGLNSDNQLIMDKCSSEPIMTPMKCQINQFIQSNQLKIKHLSCGRSHSVIVLEHMESSDSSDVVLSFGLNAHGQCGRQDDVAMNQLDDDLLESHLVKFDNSTCSRIKQVECGLDHTLFLMEDGSVWACGLGSDGQTGVGHFENTYEPTRVLGEHQHERISALSCRGDTVVALSESGRVFAWGNSEYNQLFHLQNSKGEPVLQVNSSIQLDLHALENFSGQVKQVVAAGSMCGILDEEGKVYVWGYGCLGFSKTEYSVIQPRLLPSNYWNCERVRLLSSGLHQFAIITEETNSLYLWGSPRAGFGWPPSASADYRWARPQRIPMPPSLIVKHVSCGVDHTLMLLSSLQTADNYK